MESPFFLIGPIQIPISNWKPRVRAYYNCTGRYGMVRTYGCSRYITKVTLSTIYSINACGKARAERARGGATYLMFLCLLSVRKYTLLIALSLSHSHSRSSICFGDALTTHHNGSDTIGSVSHRISITKQRDTYIQIEEDDESRDVPHQEHHCSVCVFLFVKHV